MAFIKKATNYLYILKVGIELKKDYGKMCCVTVSGEYKQMKKLARTEKKLKVKRQT